MAVKDEIGMSGASSVRAVGILDHPPTREETLALFGRTQ